jgi:hypothetical protein
VVLALALTFGAADLTPREVDDLVAERRLLTLERPSLAPPIAFIAVGALGWLAAIADGLALGALELQWSFNGFRRVQGVVDGMAIFAGIAVAAGIALGVPGAVLLVHRLIDRGRDGARVEEIDHELRLRSDVDPSRL